MRIYLIKFWNTTVHGSLMNLGNRLIVKTRGKTQEGVFPKTHSVTKRLHVIAWDYIMEVCDYGTF